MATRDPARALVAYWWDTTFVLPAGAEPRQLHATIIGRSPPTNGIGSVVFAIYKIEDGTLSLAEDDGSGKPPSTFAGATSRYVVRKVRVDGKHAGPDVIPGRGR